MIYTLPSVLTVPEFGLLVRSCDEVIRRKIRRRKIKALGGDRGTPYLIPCRELLRFGVNLEDAAVILSSKET